MKPDTTAEIVGAFGMPGMGKSTIVKHQTDTRNRVLIVDPNAEDAWAEGAEVISTKAGLFSALTAKGPMRICWRGVHGVTSKAEGIEQFELANRAALAAENLTVIWDEVDRFTSPKVDLPPYAFQMVTASRHSKIKIFFMARRPARVNRDLTSFASRMIVFRTEEPADVKYFRERSAKLAELVTGLEPYHAADWSQRGDVTVKKSPFR
jgi:hypothetical protein